MNPSSDELHNSLLAGGFPVLQFAPDSLPQVSDPAASLALPEPKPDRIWTLQTIKALYSRAKSYSAQHSKIMDSLTVDDMASIATELNKSPRQCLHKLREVVITGSFRAGQWSKAEDELLLSLIQEKRRWKECAAHINATMYGNLQVRSGKQCKERWTNHLNPAINKGRWTLQEDRRLMEAFLDVGNHWSLIAKRLDNRTENSVKNRVKSLLQAELKSFGVAERTLAARRIVSRTEREINAEYHFDTKN